MVRDRHPATGAALEAAAWVTRLGWLRWQASRSFLTLLVVPKRGSVPPQNLVSPQVIEPGHGLMPEALRESELCSIVEFRFGDS